MAVGYALLAQELTINGTASIDSTWRLEITNIQSKDVVGDAVNKVDPSYTATTANFSVGFTQPGDSITYDITVTINYEQDLNNYSGGGETTEPVVPAVYAYHTTEFRVSNEETGDALTYTDLENIVHAENRQLYQDGTELAQNHSSYLKYTFSPEDNNEITGRYVCFIANNTEHCLQGMSGGDAKKIY